MAPSSVVDTQELLTTLPHETGITKNEAKQRLAIPNEMPLPPLYKHHEDPYKEREYQKGRLALAFRIFAKLGYDEGVAGHITYRASIPQAA